MFIVWVQLKPQIVHIWEYLIIIVLVINFFIIQVELDVIHFRPFYFRFLFALKQFNLRQRKGAWQSQDVQLYVVFKVKSFYFLRFFAFCKVLSHFRFEFERTIEITLVLKVLI